MNFHKELLPHLSDLLRIEIEIQEITGPLTLDPQLM